MTNYTYNPAYHTMEQAGYRNTSGCLRAFSTVLLFIALVFIAVWLSACSSVKNTVQTDYRDSIRTEYRHDTIVITVHDTLYVESKQQSEKTDDTGIEFVEQGGTYNTQTGEATGVKNIRNTKKEKEQQQTIVRQASEIEAYKSRNDSLRQALNLRSIMGEQQQNTEDIKPKTNVWHRFLVWWFWVTAVVLLACVAWKGFKIYRRIAVGI